MTGGGLSQSFEVANAQHGLATPAVADAWHLLGDILRRPHRLEFAVDCPDLFQCLS